LRANRTCWRRVGEVQPQVQTPEEAAVFGIEKLLFDKFSQMPAPIRVLAYLVFLGPFVYLVLAPRFVDGQLVVRDSSTGRRRWATRPTTRGEVDRPEACQGLPGRLREMRQATVEFRRRVR
jgi:hypothetical protein